MEARETVADEGLQSRFCSLPLAQVDVEDGADQEQRDADPRQDKTVTKVSFPQVSGVPQYLFPVEGEDEAGSEGRETCKGLAEASEVEESSLGHGDQLTQEHQEGDGGEDHGEDHEGLDRLQPVAFIGSGAQPGLCCIVMKAVEPEVSDLRVGPNPPRLLQRSDEEHGQGDQMQHGEEDQQEDHGCLQREEESGVLCEPLRFLCVCTVERFPVFFQLFLSSLSPQTSLTKM